MTNQVLKPNKLERTKSGFQGQLLPIYLIIIFAIFVIILIPVVGLSVYKPLPAKGFAFSSAGETIQLTDGRALAYLDTGDPGGRPVFYFHGGPGSRIDGLIFDELNRKLGIRMIAIDRPGYGLSDFQKGRTYLDWPMDVRELADQLGIERFGVLGWSSGGPYAAAVAHEIPKRLTVVAIAGGEGPYARDDYPISVLEGDTFGGSRMNKLFMWSAKNGPWLMGTLFKLMRIATFNDPVGLIENSGDAHMSKKDIRFFTREEYGAELVESFRQGVEGMTRDFTIERLDWPFDLEKIHGPKVLIFHGEEDGGVHPRIAKYMCARIPTCDAPKIYPAEGHSVIYYRYEEIIEEMLKVWK